MNGNHNDQPSSLALSPFIGKTMLYIVISYHFIPKWPKSMNFIPKVEIIRVHSFHFHTKIDEKYEFKKKKMKKVITTWQQGFPQ